MDRLGKQLAIWGSVLQLALPAGFAVNLIQIGRAMTVLDPYEPTPPPEVAAAVEIAFHATTIGLVASLIGFVLILLAVSVCKYRAAWLHSVLWMVAVFWLLSFPLAALALIVCLTVAGRRAFEPPTLQTNAPETRVVSDASAGG